MRYVNQVDECQIWKGYEGAGNNCRIETVMEHSPRAGGEYVITREAKHMINDGLGDSHKARLTTILVDQRMQGVIWPTVTPELIEQAKNNAPLPVYERADRLLRFIASQIKMVGKRLSLSEQSYGAYAHSESIDWLEIDYLIKYLTENGWVRGTGYMGGHSIEVTVAGYNRIAEQAVNVNSAQAFVAMWFDKSMDDAFAKGIKPAIADAGYRPSRIDAIEHIGKIDDAIIAEIRRSKFIVADFTQGPDGARGGVYYEAGFARGLGLPVIFTCRNDSMENVHFDTNHYNHIVWDGPDDLREKLKNRILAVLGEGPRIQRNA